MPEPQTARKDLERGMGLAVLVRVAALTICLIAICSRTRALPTLLHLASLIDARLGVVTDRIFPFAEAKEATAYLETGRANGKLVRAIG